MLVYKLVGLGNPGSGVAVTVTGSLRREDRGLFPAPRAGTDQPRSAILPWRLLARGAEAPRQPENGQGM